MDILGRSIIDIQRRMKDQTDYRINVVKGIIESENINKTYNCYIAGESAIYPDIPTFSRNPKLQPGDEVTIEFINGCRGTPCILAPEDIREVEDTTSLVADVVAIYYRPNAANYNLRIHDMDGNLISDTIIGNTNAVHQWVTVDADGYVYVIEMWNTLKKYDSGGIEIASIVMQDTYAVDVSSDGYIYTLEVNGIAGWDLKKRSLADLSIISTVNFGNGNIYVALALDTDTYFFVLDDSGDNIEKRKLSDGSLVNSHALDGAAATNIASIGLLSNDIYGGGGNAGWYGWYIAKTLGAAATSWILGAGNLPYSLTVYNNQNIFISGWNGTDYVIRKYDSSRTLIWEEIIGGIALYGILAIGAASYK